jgi:vancomycin resistance protein YoaR
MYYPSNQTPPARPPAGNQRSQYPPQGVRPAGGYPGGEYRPKKRKKRGFGWQMLKLLFVLLVVAAAGAGIYVGKTYLDVAPYTSVFLDGVTVDGINLGGMTWSEGETAVRNQIKEKLGSWYVRLKSANGFYKDITAETLNISRDPEGALEAAWAVGHATDTNGHVTIFDLQNDLIAARANAYSYSSVEYDADTTVIDDILSKVAAAAYVEPKDAKMLSFNPDSTTEPFTFQQEVVGRWLDTEAIKNEILQMVNTFESGEVLLEPETLNPSMTVADLEKYYALRARVVTPIDSKSTDARNENIRVAFSKINGYIINDGSKFSFNTIVGRRTLENGFYRAYEYNYGDLVLGIGGGVCQASTTVYLAAMYAGLELVDHTSHSQKVSYTDLGMDATVSDTIGAAKDMSFRNNSGGQIFMAAHVIEDTSNKNRLLCEVRIYGMDLGDVYYTLETEVVKVLTPPSDTLIVYDSKGEYVTFDDPIKTLTEAADGYVVDTYRVTMQNGAQIARDKITRSTYPARQEKIAQWTQP